MHAEPLSNNKTGKSRFPIQTSLKIGRPGDKYEQEADRVADYVMRSSSVEPIRMQSMEYEKIKMKPELQLKNDASTEASPQLSNKIISGKGNGYALPPETQREMSSKIGADFSSVNIHTGSDASQMNRELGARAFTKGNDIYFNSGEYNLVSSKGKHLLAHELTHVVQQGNQEDIIQRYPGSLPIPNNLKRRVDKSIQSMSDSKENHLMEIADALKSGVYDIGVPDFFDTSKYGGNADDCPAHLLEPLTFSAAVFRKSQWEKSISGFETRNWTARVPGTNILLPIIKGVNAYTRQFTGTDNVIYLYAPLRHNLTEIIIHEALHLRHPLTIPPGQVGSEKERFISELRSYYYGEYRNTKQEHLRFERAVRDAEQGTGYLAGEGIPIEQVLKSRETWMSLIGTP